MNDANIGGLPFRLAVFFAINPDEWLTTYDIAAKYDVSPHGVPNTLRRIVANGWISIRFANPEKKVGRGNSYIYSAGPKLIELIN